MFSLNSIIINTLFMELICPKPTYVIKDAPLYETFEVTAASQNILNVLQAFDFAAEQARTLGKPALLQGIGEALVARVIFYECNKKSGSRLDKTDNYQKTSTVSLRLKNDGLFKFKVDSPYVVGFVELDNKERSRALVQEGYDANCKGKELIKPIKDAFICNLIARARDNNRFAPAIEENPLKLSTAQVKGKSEYGQHPNVVAVFGSVKLGELNASYLNERGYDAGFVCDFTAKDLEVMLKGKEDSAHMRSVGLGYGCSINGIYAYDYFNKDGSTRAVVHVDAQKVPVEVPRSS